MRTDQPFKPHYHLTQLTINQLRNLGNIDLQPNATFNLFWGDNGAGKTSILEAIYYLSTARSFRTPSHEHLIQHDKAKLSIFAQLQTQDSSIPMGIERQRDGSCRLRCQHQDVASAGIMTAQLPVQIIEPQSHHSLIALPAARRRFLDWGVFHVEPAFKEWWRTYHLSLKQRNAALKKGMPTSWWDENFCQVAEKIDQARADYLASLSPLLTSLCQFFLPETNIEVIYRRGWSQEKSFSDALLEHQGQDRHLGHTSIGPHRADLIFRSDNHPVQMTLSQGQKKMFAYALKLAQIQRLNQEQNKSCLCLLDDVPAELDTHKLEQLFTTLININCQIFMSSITPLADYPSLRSQTVAMFHVKQGKI